MNFFYLDDDKNIIMDITATENIENIIYSVPNGIEFYLYTPDDDFQEIINTQ